MRLLVILSLILASLAMTAPVAAQQGDAGMPCHTTPLADDEHAPGPQDADEHAAFHVCPGCACIGPAVPSADVQSTVADYRTPSVQDLISLAANPIPPPPRAA
jgi:hypothetical protein